jgi:hypothetical protein
MVSGFARIVSRVPRPLHSTFPAISFFLSFFLHDPTPYALQHRIAWLSALGCKTLDASMVQEACHSLRCSYGT